MPESTVYPPAMQGGPRLVPPPDLRDVITQDAFRLAPELLGTPLARPWRRGLAMALDGIFIALLSSASAVLFAMAAVVVLFRISGKPAPGGYVRKSIRLVLRFWAAMILFVLVLMAWDAVDDRLDRRGAAARTEAADDAPSATGGTVTGLRGARVGLDMGLLMAASTETEARAIAERLVPALRASEMSDADIRELFEGQAELSGRPWLAAIADSALGGAAAGAEEAVEPDSVAGAAEAAVLAHAAALERGDTAAARETRGAAASVVAGDTIAALLSELERQARIRDVALQRADRLEEQLEEGPGLMGWFRALADDLGLGLGWAGLYFTTFLTLWKGRTPGKRILGIRVIRLDGQQIGWWAAFERFGGYAAGVATGLLGFVQIYWDRNRQGVHDKISETVVIRDAPRAP